ncbi:hypothetical protein HDV00_005793 [Rhizophlyctis rosea]|nr:hypothetical protein HDV00_005793 [Rhizophlyctis rosea]
MAQEPNSGSVLYQGMDVSAFSADTFDLKAWVNSALTVSDATASTSTSGRTGLDEEAEPFATSIEEGRPGEQGRMSIVSTNGTGDDGTMSNVGPPIRGDSFSEDTKPPDTTSIDQLASTLVLKLQLYSHEVSNRLNLLSDETVRNMPRVMYDLDSVKKEAASLRSTVAWAKSEFATADGENAAFQDLVRLDAVRTRMEHTRQSLKEAENWSTLAPEIENIFAEGDFLRAAIRLEEAQRSLGLLASAPDYEDRKLLLSDLRKRLEESISPSLVAALNEHDAEETKRIYSIYSRMGRASQFLDSYHQARKDPIQRIWQRYDTDPSIKAAEGRGERTFADWLGPFYEEVFLVLNKEYSWGAYIFPDAEDVTRSLIAKVFRGLDPPLEKRLAEVSGRLRDGALPVIIKAYQQSVALGQKVERLFHTSNDEQRLEPTSSFDSLRASPQPDVSTWGQVLFEPFLPFQLEYTSYELKYLCSLAGSVLPGSKKYDHVETARMMADSVPKVFAYADAAVVRCRQFTLGYGLVGLVDCLNQYITHIVDKYIALLADIRSDTGSHDVEVAGGENDDEDDDYDLGKGMLGRQDWGHFQAGIRILGMCPVMRRRVVGLPGVLRRLVVAVKARLNEGREGRDRGGEERDVGEECLASLSLLKLSTLNSYKLHTLIDALEEEVEVSRGQIVAGEVTEEGGVKTDTRSPNTTFKPALERLSAFTMRTQRLVYDAIFETVNKHLSGVPTLDVWQSAPPTTSGPFNLEVPQFSLSPQPYATRIGEHLLTLPQHLELHAGDDSLGFSLKTLPYLTSADFAQLGDGTGEGGGDGDTSAPEDVLNLWITSIARGTMSSFADAILRIGKLSPHGGRQLETDVGYIVNVFSAMDIEPLPKLKAIMEMVESSSDVLDAMWKERRGGNGGVGAGDGDVIRRIAMMRGIVLTP